MATPANSTPAPAESDSRATNDNRPPARDPDLWALLIDQWRKAGLPQLALNAIGARAMGYSFSEYVETVERIVERLDARDARREAAQ